MKAKFIVLVVSIGLLSIVSNMTSAAVVFSDGFESADMSATNPQGFAWADNNRTTIVTQSPTDGPVAVWNNGKIYNIHPSTYDDGTTRNWTAKTGSYSLRFRYPAGQAQAEQRFDTGTPMKDLWISYWLRVPTNFSYGSTGEGTDKFLSMWQDGYEGGGVGSTVWLSMHRSGTGATLGLTYTTGNNTGSLGYQQDVPFITTADRGKWMKLVIHFKTESSPGASDGMIETYRLWNGSTQYIRLHQALNLPLKVPPNGPNGFKSGYILGWANAAYDVETDWLLDDFTIYDSKPNMVIGKAAMYPGNIATQ